jgi:hypothetical protein
MGPPIPSTILGPNLSLAHPLTIPEKHRTSMRVEDTLETAALLVRNSSWRGLRNTPKLYEIPKAIVARMKLTTSISQP